MPREDTQFKKGNPGRPFGAVGVKQRVINSIFKIYEENPELLEEAIRKEYKKDAGKVLLKYMMTLLPKEDKLKLSSDEPITIKVVDENNRNK